MTRTSKSPNHLEAGLATLFLILTACSGWAAQPDERRFDGGFTYMDAERINYYRIVNGEAISGTMLRSIAPTGVTIEGPHRAPAYNCSDAAVRCIKNDRIVFAVPAGAITEGMNYNAAGTEFKVEKCLREVQGSCQIALISADCQYIKNVQACDTVAGGRSLSPQPGPFNYFIYNEEYGITSLGFSPRQASSDEGAAFISRRFVLQGDVGLLKR